MSFYKGKSPFLELQVRCNQTQKEEEKTPKPGTEGCCQHQELNNIGGYLLLWK
jgi:hypothetical protein